MRPRSSEPIEKIAVLGASGLVGSAIVQHLTSNNISAVAVVRNVLSASIAEQNSPGCEVRIGSVERDDTRQDLIGDCSTVINCALAGSGGIPAQAYTRNRAIIDGIVASDGVRRLIHFSTVAIYGEVCVGIRNSTRAFEHPTSNSEYGRSKLDVEQYALRLAQKRGLGYTGVRLGHVYGPSVGRSRGILDLMSTPGFALPFNGRHPSDAVHIRSVASAITALVQDGTGPEIVNLFEPDKSWREVFDWHADAVEFARAAMMTDDASLAGQQRHMDTSVLKAAKRWGKSLPVNELIRTPAVFDFVLRNLARSPVWLTDRASAVNRKVKRRSAAVVSSTGSGMLWPPQYYSEGAPGPLLRAADGGPLGSTEDKQRRADFARWYRQITVPRLPEVNKPQ